MGMVREERELKGQVLGFPLLGGKLVLLTTLLTDTKYASFSHINNQFSTLQTPTECPTIQLDSDTNYLELASDFTDLKAQSHEAALTSEASHKFWVPRVKHTSV